MTPTRRLLTAVLTCLLLGVGLLATVAPPASAKTTKVTLNSVGERYVGAAIPIVGYLSGAGKGLHTTLSLQRKMDGSWHADGRLADQGNGKFRFPARHVQTPQIARWRVVAKQHGKQLDVSQTLTVKVIAKLLPPPPPAPTCATAPSPTLCPQPPDLVQPRDVVGLPVCSPDGGGTVTTVHQVQHQPYVWNPVTLTWEPGAPLEWVDDPSSPPTVRDATEDECAPLSAQMRPDLVIKNLTHCSAEERAETGTCFRIREVNGKRLLKFPVVTANAGDGPMEIHATRTSTSDLVWSARQIITMDDGSTIETGLPGMNFFFAGDGHSHWHITDFDSYKLLSGPGQVAVGEKHGYCLEDNTTLPDVDTDPVYTHDVVCGDGQPAALEITHGLSVGWGDTYPSSLPDQALDITTVPDGTYTVKICADQLGLLREVSESNNCATVNVVLDGDEVTPVPGTDTGF